MLARLPWLILLLFVSVHAGAQAVLATVAAGSEPRAIAVNAKTGKAYVANEFSNDVTVVDGATQATTRVAVGRRPQYIAVNTATNKVFVSNAQDASISVIDGATLAVQAYLVNGSGPFLIDEAINRVYMARLGNADEVTYFDATADTWYTIATDSYSPVALALNPYTKRLFVANAASGDVRIVDTTSPSDYPPSVSVGVWSKPVAVGVNAATNKAYVATLDARGPIAVVDGNSNAATFLAPPGHLAGATSLVVSPWTNKVYGGFANEVAVLDGATDALTYVPTGPVVALALDATSNVVYALTSTGSVVAIDGATNATTTYPIPAGGKAIAVDPVANRVYVAGTSGVTVLQGLGAAGTPPPMPAPAAASFGANVQGMWWASPGGSESGWGIDIAHQGNMLFATWFTYDANGQPTWLVMSSGFRNGDNAYTGDLYRLTGASRVRRVRPTARGAGEGRRRVALVRRCRQRQLHRAGGWRERVPQDHPLPVQLAGLALRLRCRRARHAQLPGHVVELHRERLGGLPHPPGRYALPRLVHVRRRWEGHLARGLQRGPHGQRHLCGNGVSHDRPALQRVPLGCLESPVRRGWQRDTHLHGRRCRHDGLDRRYRVQQQIIDAIRVFLAPSGLQRLSPGQDWGQSARLGAEHSDPSGCRNPTTLTPVWGGRGGDFVLESKTLILRTI